MSLSEQLVEGMQASPPAANTSQQAVAYELPLNERVRTLLRLEGLFGEIRHHNRQDSSWDSRAAIKTLLAILTVFHNRPDTKTEIIKELDRIAKLLQRYANLERVNPEALREMQAQLQKLASTLRTQPGKPGEALRKNDFIAALKQRENIPGGTLAFELPSYAHWLALPAQQRRQHIETWLEEFEPMERAARLLLKILRESTTARHQTASEGFFQASLDSEAGYQMIRVILPAGAGCCAEISGGRHRFSVRFLRLDAQGRSLPCKHDIDFSLACCAL